MSIPLFLWLFVSVALTPLALFWRPGARRQDCGPLPGLVWSIGTAGYVVVAYFSFRGIA